jgi:hypothetical protein
MMPARSRVTPLLAVAFVILISCASELCSATELSIDQCRRGCKPVPGNATRRSCAVYRYGINSTDTSGVSRYSWLPYNYASAAYCACTGLPIAPSSNCVREALHQFTFETNGSIFFPDTYREELGKMKRAYCSPTMWCDDTYYSYLNTTGFATRIYGMHVKAYSECCCPGAPAPEWAWEMIVQMGSMLSLSCPFEIWTIKTFGACKCDGW